MVIDFQTMLMALLGLCCTVMGWFLRELWGAVKSLRSDLSALEVRISQKALKADLAALEVHITKDFVSFDRLADAMRPILEGINEIKHTLEGKADKP
jgi:hypothetical protein